MNLNLLAKEVKENATKKGFYSDLANPHFHRLIQTLVEQYGDKRALEAKISMGYNPDTNEVP